MTLLAKLRKWSLFILECIGKTKFPLQPFPVWPDLTEDTHVQFQPPPQSPMKETPRMNLFTTIAKLHTTPALSTRIDRVERELVERLKLPREQLVNVVFPTIFILITNDFYDYSWVLNLVSDTVGYEVPGFGYEEVEEAYNSVNRSLTDWVMTKEDGERVLDALNHSLRDAGHDFLFYPVSVPPSSSGIPDSVIDQLAGAKSTMKTYPETSPGTMSDDRPSDRVNRKDDPKQQKEPARKKAKRRNTPVPSVVKLIREAVAKNDKITMHANLDGNIITITLPKAKK